MFLIGIDQTDVLPAAISYGKLKKLTLSFINKIRIKLSCQFINLYIV